MHFPSLHSEKKKERKIEAKVTHVPLGKTPQFYVTHVLEHAPMCTARLSNRNSSNSMGSCSIPG